MPTLVAAAPGRAHSAGFGYSCDPSWLKLVRTIPAVDRSPYALPYDAPGRGSSEGTVAWACAP
jgi:hypothetical protein